MSVSALYFMYSFKSVLLHVPSCCTLSTNTLVSSCLVSVDDVHLAHQHRRGAEHRNEGYGQIEEEELPWTDVDAFLGENLLPQQAREGRGERQGECSVVGT